MRALVLAMALLLTACTGSSHPRPVAQPSVRADLPACPPAGEAVIHELEGLRLPCFGATSDVDVSRLTGPLVVNLYAGWCRPCVKELPAMQRLHESGRVSVLGVNALDEARNGKETVVKYGLTYPSLYDYDGLLLDRLPVRRGLPVTFFVDAGGRITKTYQGGALTDAALQQFVRDSLGVDL